MIMKNKILLLSLLSLLLLSACSKEDISTLHMAISSEKCTAIATVFGIEIPGLMTQLMEGDGTWSELSCSDIPYRIEGFTYIEGYEYELLIRKTEPKIDRSIMDGPDPSYSLIRVIARTPVDGAR